MPNRFTGTRTPKGSPRSATFYVAQISLFIIIIESVCTRHNKSRWSFESSSCGRGKKTFGQLYSSSFHCIFQPQLTYNCTKIIMTFIAAVVRTYGHKKTSPYDCMSDTFIDRDGITMIFVFYFFFLFKNGMPRVYDMSIR